MPFGGASEEIDAEMERLSAVCDICRLLIFITHPSHLQKMMEVRREYFNEPYPASTVVICSLANPEWLLEAEATAALAPK